MRWTGWHWAGRGCVAIGLAAAATGCATAPEAGDAKVDYVTPTLRTPQPAAVVDGQPAATPAGVTPPGTPAAPVVPPPAAPSAGYGEMPTPPADSRFTIFCQSYAGPGHQENARRMRDALRAGTSLHKWYVVHAGDQSTLYYGFYRAVGRDADDPVEGERAMADLTAVRTLHDSRGQRLFGGSLPVPIDSPDPSANPAWDVTRSGGVWSLEVGVFKDSADRKVRAVEAVAEFRKQGVAAFYYHGPRASSVCVGAWPRAAASEVTTDQQNYDPDKPLLVTPTPMSERMAKEMDPGFQAIAPHVEPVDPSMIAAIRAYPDHFVNGYVMEERNADGHGNGKAVEHSFLFKIPAASSPSSAGDAIVAGDRGLPTPPAATVTPSASRGASQLRSLGN